MYIYIYICVYIFKYRWSTSLSLCFSFFLSFSLSLLSLSLSLTHFLSYRSGHFSEAQWSALKKIECLLDVILTSGDQTALQAPAWM